MKNFKYLFLLTVILSCASNFDSISEEEVMIDSLKSELNSKDKVLKYLEFNKENNDSIVNWHKLTQQHRRPCPACCSLFHTNRHNIHSLTALS